MEKDIQTNLDSRSIKLRKTIVSMVLEAGRGHLASALSIVEILRVLYDDVMHYDSKNPSWSERDRCILSKGHGCLALYAILADKGFFDQSELWKFCKSDGILGGHPEYGKIPGVEASTGSLGHGLAIGVGFALSAKLHKAKRKVYVVIGDGEMNEGAIWEGALCAAKHKLGNLTVLVDYNKQQSYDSTCNVLDMEPICDKWSSFGFSTLEVDGHDVGRLRQALASADIVPNKPTVIICHTTKGKGINFIEKDLNWHHKSRLSSDETDALTAVFKDK